MPFDVKFNNRTASVPGLGESRLSGELEVPGDKSISHRAVMLGSIAKGKTRVSGFLFGEDNISTIEAFRSMGIEIDDPKDGKLVIVIKGQGLRGLSEPNGKIDCGNSGTTARLLTGLLAPQDFTSTLTGDSSLVTRPMGRIVKPLRLMGAKIEANDGNDKITLPYTIEGSSLKGVSYNSPIASAQLKSAILLAGLYAEEETTVIEPAKSRDHTERMLEHFGVPIKVDDLSITVSAIEDFCGRDIQVPGDISSAAFFMVAALLTDGSELMLRNVGVNPTRTGIIDILRKMGATIELPDKPDSAEPSADILIKHCPLKGIDIDGAELLPAIDEFPILCVAAAFAHGETRISGAAELRVKESDRITAMAKALTSVGVEVEEKEDGIIIQGSSGELIKGGEIESLSDHRIAMAMAIAGLMSEDEINIKDFASVEVSFPDFFGVLRRMVNNG
jgi:3-phosphoshikimate 1-carboxyvinyltransferase